MFMYLGAFFVSRKKNFTIQVLPSMVIQGVPGLKNDAQKARVIWPSGRFFMHQYASGMYGRLLAYPFHIKKQEGE